MLLKAMKSSILKTHCQLILIRTVSVIKRFKWRPSLSSPLYCDGGRDHREGDLKISAHKTKNAFMGRFHLKKCVSFFSLFPSLFLHNCTAPKPALLGQRTTQQQVIKCIPHKTIKTVRTEVLCVFVGWPQQVQPCLAANGRKVTLC